MNEGCLTWVRSKRRPLFAVWLAVFSAWLCLVFGVDHWLLNRPERIVSLPSIQRCAQLTAVKGTIVIGDPDASRAYVIEERTGTVLYGIDAEIHKYPLYGCRVCTDGDLLFAAPRGLGGTISVHSLQTGDLVTTIPCGASGHGTPFMSARDGILALRRSNGARIYVLDALSGSVLQTVDGLSEIASSIWAGPRLVAAAGNASIFVFDDPTTAPNVVPYSSCGVNSAWIGPGDDKLPLWDDDMSIRLLSLSDPAKRCVRLRLPAVAISRPGYYSLGEALHAVSGRRPLELFRYAGICHKDRVFVQQDDLWNRERRGIPGRILVCDSGDGSYLGALVPPLCDLSIAVADGRLYVAGVHPWRRHCEIRIYDAARVPIAIPRWPIAWAMVLVALAIVAPPPQPKPGTELLWRLLLPQTVEHLRWRWLLCLALCATAWITVLPIGVFQPGGPYNSMVVGGAMAVGVPLAVTALYWRALVFRKMMHDRQAASELLALSWNSRTFATQFSRYFWWVLAQLLVPLVAFFLFLDAATGMIGTWWRGGVLIEMLGLIGNIIGLLILAIWAVYWLLMHPWQPRRMLAVLLAVVVYETAAVYVDWRFLRGSRPILAPVHLNILAGLPLAVIGLVAWLRCRRFYVEELRVRLFG